MEKVGNQVWKTQKQYLENLLETPLCLDSNPPLLNEKDMVRNYDKIIDENWVGVNDSFRYQNVQKKTFIKAQN